MPPASSRASTSKHHRRARIPSTLVTLAAAVVLFAMEAQSAPFELQPTSPCATCRAAELGRESCLYLPAVPYILTPLYALALLFPNIPIGSSNSTF